MSRLNFFKEFYMRKTLFFLTLFLSSLSSSSQMYQYVNFSDSAKWTYFSANSFLPAGEIYTISTREDTIINNKSYYKIFYNDSLYIGGLREDSSIIYYMPDSIGLGLISIDFYLPTSTPSSPYDFNSECILYDFTSDTMSFTVQQTITTFINTSTVNIDNALRNKYNGGNGSEDDGVIEGIGRLKHFFSYLYSTANVSGYNADHILICFEDFSSNITYQPVDTFNFYINFPTQYVVVSCDSIESVLTSNINLEHDNIVAYPNPLNGNSIFNIDNIKNYHSVRVYDVSGKLVSEKEINSTSIQIDFYNYKSGIYYVELSSSKTENQVFKVLKPTLPN